MRRARHAATGPAYAVYQRAHDLHRRGQMRAAAPLYVRATELEPMNGALLYACGNFAVEVGDHRNAEVYLGRAAATPWGSHESRVWHALSVALSKNENLPHAEDAAREAVRCDPRNILAWVALGVLAAQANDLPLARDRWAYALTITPRDQEARYSQAQLHAMLGQYEQAWPLWESRLLVKRVSGYALPTPGYWTGAALRGKPLLLVGEGGYGDEIQFMRFAPVLVQRHDGPIIFACRGGNMDLYRSFDGITRVVERHESYAPGAPHPAPEAVAQVKLWSLPLRLGLTSPSDWPAASASLPRDVQRWQPRSVEGSPDTPRRIGFCWRGSSKHGNDFDRSAPDMAALHEPLAVTSPGALLINLTQGDPDYAGGASWRATADVLRSLDVFVTVDTAITHVALALGVPTVVIVPGASEWRWGLGDVSPWYADAPHAAMLVRKQGCYAGAQPWQDAAQRAAQYLRGTYAEPHA